MALIDEEDICHVCLDVNNSISQIQDVFIKDLYQYFIVKSDKRKDSIYLCGKCEDFLKKIIHFKDVCFRSCMFLESYLDKDRKIDPENLLQNKPSLNLVEEYETSHSHIKDENVDSLTNIKLEEFIESPSFDPEDDIKAEDSPDDNLAEYSRKKLKKKKKCVNVPKKIKKKKVDVDSEDEVQITDKNLSHLSRQEQICELEERRQREEFIKATYKCNDCAVSFTSSFYLENHMKKHDISSGDLQCWLCKMRFSNKSSRKNHVWIHSIRMVCHICPYKTNAKVRLLRHLKWHAGYSYTCRICRSTFSANHLLEKHERLHRFDAPKTDGTVSANQVICEKCNFVCSSPAYLLKHQKIHLKSDQNYCVECDTYFKTEYGLNYHLKSTSVHKDQSLLRYKCVKCTKCFETEDQLSLHVQSYHDKIAKFSCEVCGARYATRHGLNFHRRKVHQGFVLPLKYECMTCNKKFSTSSILKNHTRTHTGERPFECKECDWKFSHSSALRTHVKLKHLKIKNPVEKPT